MATRKTKRDLVNVKLLPQFAQVSLGILNKVLDRKSQILQDDESGGLEILRDMIQDALIEYMRGG